MSLTTTASLTSAASNTRHVDAGLLAQLPTSARTVIRLLQRMTVGSLTVYWPQGYVGHYGVTESADLSSHAHTGLQTTLYVHDWQVCERVLKSGDIGFAESYMDQQWHTTDLAALLKIFIANRQVLDQAIYGHWWGRMIYRVRHLLNRNTKANSRKNIHAHYDLGNAFYQLWLDETMNYSSALFATNDLSLAQAQHHKVQRALSLCRVQPGDRVLEIGCGWGALAEKATQEFGAYLTGVTLSTEQLSFAKDRLQRLGQAHHADLRLQDYRDIDDGPYDAICSIEMIEAVGQSYWPTYFETIARLLKSGGRACIQSITIQDELFERYVRSTDFIQQYIFPGGCLPSPQMFRQQAEAAGLRIEDELAFGQDYARTCALWRERFLSQREAVLALNFDDRFIRTWEFYLAYCEAGFAMGDLDLYQFTLVKP